MNNLSNFQYPPPKNWQDFESLCHDLWEKIWNDPDTQKNGRSGQEQKGVDVFGQPRQTVWSGVQCKGKDNYSKKTVTVQELIDEVEKAKKFKPGLFSWILATTGARDVAVQQKARELTDEHAERGLFSVTVWCWEDIVERLVNYPSLITKHLPQIGNLDPAYTQKISDIDLTTRKMDFALTEQTSAIESISKSIVEVEKKVEGIQNVAIQDILTVEYNSEIDDIRVLVNEHQYGEAIKAFERLKKRIWSSASYKVKYRILTNIGNAYYGWGKLDEAGPLFIEAYQYNPDDEASLTNLSIAYSFQADFEKTEQYAQRILEKNPASFNGFSILLQIPPYKNSYDDALTLVPENLRNKPLIAFCLGLAAQNEKRFDSALERFETALANDTENSPDFKANIAVMLMQSLWGYKSPLLYGQISDDDRQILERSVQLLDEAWKQIESNDLKNVHPVWLLNRGIGKKLLGDFNAAYNDIKAAHDLNSADVEFSKHLALILLRKDDYAGASEILEKIRFERSVPEISTILADIYNSTGEYEKAVSVINDFSEWNEDEQLKFLSYRILVDIYLKLDDEENAQLSLNRLVEEFPDTVSTYVSAARVSGKHGNDNEAFQFLVKAKRLYSEKTFITDLVELGDEFFALGKFKEAAECYERFTDIEQDTRFTLTLLFCYYNAGILSKALNLCRIVREKCGMLPKHAEIEIGVLEEINDLPESKKLAVEYVEKFPGNLSVKLRLARLNYLSGNFSELERFLSEDIDYSAVSLENGLTISSFLAQVGKIKESFDLMYEMRRKYFGEADAHAFYMANFFMNDRDGAEWLHSETVTKDFAVCLERIDEQREWYVIEDRPDADFQKREFQINHPLVQSLFGKKIGDKILLKRSTHNKESAQIVEIKSKYIYALHETSNVYESMFPDRNDFWSIHIGDPDAAEDETQDRFEKIRAMLAARSKLKKEAMDLYQTANFTVGLIAGALGLAAYEAWELLLSNSEGLTFCSGGNQPILEHTVSLLSKDEPPKLAADITSIYLARSLNVADKIVGHFGKLLIAPTTLFSLYRKLEETKKNRTSGSLSLIEEAGVLYKNEVTPEEVEQRIYHLGDLINWLENNCEVLPHQAGLDIERNQKAQIRKALLSEFLDTSLIVKNENYLFFTEDDRLNNVSKNELAIQRAWMQPVLITLKNKKVISEDEYDELILKLASSNLTHIHFDASLIMTAARKANWLPDGSYNNVLRRLRGGRADIQSATDVAVNFLFDVYDAPLSAERWQVLLVNLLANLTYNRNQRETLNLLRQKVKRRFRFLPIQETDIINTISAWKNSRLVVV